MSGYKCPSCGHVNEFEKRGEQRTYHPLDVNLGLDTWNNGEITLDTFGIDGEDVIYCTWCESEWRQEELTPA